MHILIIPSEEFVPDDNHLAGIFQYHQASILSEAGYKVGVISVKQTFSILMLIKSLLFKCISRIANNATDGLSFRQVLALGYKKIFKIEEFLKVEKREKLSIYRINGFYYLPPSDVNNRFGWIKAGMVAYNAYVKNNGTPDIIHAHNALYAAILAERIKKKHHVPYIVTEHSSIFAKNTITNSSLLNYTKQAYRNSNGAFAVSQPFCNLLGSKFPGILFSCLPNVIDPFLEGMQYVGDKKNNKKEFIFLNIAELHPKKNQKLLIDAFKKVKLFHPVRTVKLWIGGHGELYDNLKEYIHLAGLDPNVKLLGRLNRQQVFDTIGNCDCFVISSPYETFGVVLIEAMLLGKPVISTRCGGPEAFVNDVTGILVSRDNEEEEFFKAMLQMIEGAGKYDPQMIREYAINEFGQTAFVRRINTIYKQIIQSK